MRRKILIIISLVLLLVGCRTTQIVKEKTEDRQVRTEQNSKTEKDSVFVMQRDSVIVRQIGDTVLLEKIKYEYRYELGKKEDTIILRDTIYRREIKDKIEKDKGKSVGIGIERIGYIFMIIGLTIILIWQVLRRYTRS
ncbi:MAG: hypothetical protein IJ180_09620 [Bacteroidales bacterium]|nr:hypothetical protein [Bacteroidales bacterium]